MLFAEVGKFWAPKPRSRKKSQDLDTAEEPVVSGAERNAVEDGKVVGDCGDTEIQPDEAEDSHTPNEEINGVSTPPSRVLNDEYLAWTLGGGSPWVPDTPKELEQFQRDMDLVRIDKKIAELENLRL